MDEQKKKAIELVVDTAISAFAEGLISRYREEVNDINGVINMKKNNCFIAELGEEFMFYSAFVRSFDSSFGNILEKMGNNIAQLSYEVKGSINSFILPDQTQRIATVLDNYLGHITKPEIDHYESFSTIYPKDITSFIRTHKTDNYFYSPSKNEHYLIELKASGDLDNKKARAEKSALLEEYFLLKNLLKDDKSARIKIFFGTAYNKFGEGNSWKQERVKQFFADEELLIGKDYWNFVCDDDKGFETVFNQYKLSSNKIKDALNEIKKLYF
ncbi:MAG: TdeIII family type II restriction endonuclease [Clostridia bacterium]|nr:TdeIII family type II restriction endonuclease [Clostridia bacterium]